MPQREHLLCSSRCGTHSGKHQAVRFNYTQHIMMNSTFGKVNSVHGRDPSKIMLHTPARPYLDRGNKYLNHLYVKQIMQPGG